MTTEFVGGAALVVVGTVEVGGGVVAGLVFGGTAVVGDGADARAEVVGVIRADDPGAVAGACVVEVVLCMGAVVVEVDVGGKAALVRW